MAQDDITPTAAPNGNGAANGAEQPLQLIVNAQYIKDLSFENPRAPQSLVPQKTQPEVALDVDVKANTMGPDLFEVILTISASAKIEGEPIFVVQLAYGAVVTVKNASQEMLTGMILIETPRLLFPFARNIVAQATRDGGFPPLLINTIDFAEILRREQQKRQATETIATA